MDLSAVLPHRPVLAHSSNAILTKCRYLQGTPLYVPDRAAVRNMKTSAIHASTERFYLNNIGPQPGSRKRNKRKGRGHSAGQGGSCGFGMKGQKARSGPGIRPGFEGGQMPLYRRLPKLRGIAGGMSAGLPKFVIVNLRDIERAGFQDGDEVSLETLKSKRIINPSGREAKLRLKVLGDGDLTKKLSVKAGAFSSSAKSKLESLGCTLITVPGRKKWVRPSILKHQARAAEYFAKKFGASSQSTEPRETAAV